MTELWSILTYIYNFKRYDCRAVYIYRKRVTILQYLRSKFAKIMLTLF